MSTKLTLINLVSNKKIVKKGQTHRKLFIRTALYLKGIVISRGMTMRDRHLNSWDRRVPIL
jgi:hypothetical protein